MSRYRERGLDKRLGLIFIACVALAGSGCALNMSEYGRTSGEYDYYADDFDFLAQYGEWMGVPSFGVVWRPYVDDGWEPFYDGRWVRTSDGWAWDSYEPFGDIVYHYGYWYFDGDLGWFWVPGDEWSPARVQWYTYGDVSGWAPLPPPDYYWPDPWNCYDCNVWVFVNIDHFCDELIGRSAIDRTHYQEILKRELGTRTAPPVKLVKELARRDIPIETLVKHPLGDIVWPGRQAGANVKGESPPRVPKTLRTRENDLPEPNTPGGQRNDQPEPKTVEPRKVDPPPQRTVEPRKADQPERKTVEPRKVDAPQQRTVTSPQVDQRQGDTPASRQADPPGQKTLEPRKTEQPQQKDITPRQTDPPRQRTVEPRKADQPEQRTVTPAPSRTAERSVDRAPAPVTSDSRSRRGRG